MKVGKNHQNLGEQNNEQQGSNTILNNLDLSLLRQPITTSVTGLEEVLRAYNDGTNELKKLLSKECDLIYECKVCRNIFRSLTNFISHKRVYCRSSFNPSDHFHFRNNGFVVQDISAIIQAEQKITNNPIGIAGILPGTDDKSKDLSGVVEHILWKQHQSRSSNVSDVYDQIKTTSNRSTSNPDNNQTLLLNPVNDSDIAVYQSLQTDNDNSNMRDELNEVHNMLKKKNTIVDADGKVINLFSKTSSLDNGNSTLLTCKICHLQFETEKTLKLHLEIKHSPCTYVYQCPCCIQKFSSSATVLKHLSNDHKKSNRRIRLMRDNIIKRRVRADEASSMNNKSSGSNTSRELQQLQKSNNFEVYSNKIDNDTESNNSKNDNTNVDSQYVCPSCLKNFDRKAVYIGHVQMCSDIKDREQEKLKKRKAKDGTKMNKTMIGILESEDNSNNSEQRLRNIDMTKDKCRGKRKSKENNKFDAGEREIEISEENSEDIVDWNLDDEEEKRNLDNIKKEIIEDEYNRRNCEANSSSNQIKQEINNEDESSANDDDDDDSGLIIDEKPELGETELKCPTCNKVFGTSEKLNYHLKFYHSRQKRFKCKMCEYQGYRKKDTMNHINFVHNENVTLETLGNYTETVSKAVNEEDVKIQNELKKNQLKIKRKMARERQRKKAAEAQLVVIKCENNIKTDDKTVEKDIDLSTSENDKSIKIPHKSLITTPKSSHKADLNAIEQSIKSEDSKHEHRNYPLIKKEKLDEKNDINDSIDDDSSSIIQRRESAARICKSPSISCYGKVVKNVPVMDTMDSANSSRPIRNRIKPVRKDFLYDLSDLLKKEADAYREQVFQSSNITNVTKRELRKRAMSTHTRETPSLNTFDQQPSVKKSTLDFLIQRTSTNSSEESPSKFKDQRNRRMSVFVPPTRSSMFPPQPRSPPYRPPASHKNAGAAYKMALKEFDSNCASLYDPKFLWTICFEQENEKIPVSKPLSSVSAAASILQRLSNSKNVSNDSVKLNVPNESSNPLTADQLCKKFELINVTNINDLDIPVSNAVINLNPGVAENNLISLNLDEVDNDVCVLQECESEDSNNDSNGDSDEASKLEIESVNSKNTTIKRKYKRSRSKKQIEKRKLAANTQRRLTVMQRLQENKIRKSREQLFQRLIHQQNDNADSQSSADFDLYTES